MLNYHYSKGNFGNILNIKIWNLEKINGGNLHENQIMNFNDIIRYLNNIIFIVYLIHYNF